MSEPRSQVGCVGVALGVALLAGPHASAQVIGMPCPASQCSKSVQILTCDNRRPGPTTSPQGDSPWRHVGRFSGTGIGACTGTLIGPRHVLTAAHCVLDGHGAFRSGSVGFSLAQYSKCGKPHGTHFAERIFVPTEYTGSEDPVTKSSDWAVVELRDEIPGAQPLAFGFLSWNTVKDKTPFSVGYPADKPEGTLWDTGAASDFQSAQPHAWIDDGARGLFYVTNDGVGGQSGSPIYVFHSGRRRLVGVFIGSPVAHCRAGRTWAARLTPGTVERIQNGMKWGTIVDFSLRRFEVTLVPANELAQVVCTGTTG